MNIPKIYLQHFFLPCTSYMTFFPCCQGGAFDLTVCHGLHDFFSHVVRVGPLISLFAMAYMTFFPCCQGGAFDLTVCHGLHDFFSPVVRVGPLISLFAMAYMTFFPLLSGWGL